MKYFAYVQDNWITIVLIITALIVLLKAIAHFRVRWAKITPDKADDVEALLFSKKIGVIIGFLKDIFLPVKKKKNDGGFVQISIMMALCLFLIGIVIGVGIHSKYAKPKEVVVSVPEFIEVQKIVKVEVESKHGSINTVKEYNCDNGNLSSEKTLEEYFAEKSAKEQAEIAKKSEELQPDKLDLFLGAGAQITTGDKLRSIEKITPQIAAGGSYEKYGGLAASDLDRNHAIYGFRKWSW